MSKEPKAGEDEHQKDMAKLGFEHPKRGELIQIIDFDGNFSPNLSQSMRIWDQDILKKGFDYYLTSIIGAQSSGKSTLLNLLFGTTFVVMNATAGRTQTTKGIWLAKATNSDVFVLDVEGTDSRERGEGHVAFERKSSLFSLAIAEILLINLWEKDIGRHEAANYSTFKTIFELNLQLFQKSKTRKTLLLFVIRDADGDTPIERLRGRLTEDLNGIWAQLGKPEDFKGNTLADFFDFDFVALPSKKWQPDLFLQKVKELQGRFVDPHNPGYFFKETYRTDIPADGVAPFAQHVWQTIQENRDLDLPSEKEMLAMFRCEELLEQSYTSFTEEIASMKATIEKGEIVPTFGTQAKNIYKENMDKYSLPASRYHKEVAEKKRELLKEKMMKDLQTLYQLQLVKIRQNTIEEFDKSVLSAFPKDGKAVKGFTLLANEIRSKTLGHFTKAADQSMIQDEGWGYDTEITELKNLIESRMTTEKETQSGNLLSELKARIKSEILAPITPLLDAADHDMWKKIRAVYRKNYLAMKKYYLEIIAGYDFKPEDFAKRKKEFKELVFRLFKELVKTKVGFLNYKMEKRFNDLFKYDEKGLPKRWLPGDKVAEKCTFAREKAEEIIDLYSIIRLKDVHDSLSFFTPIDHTKDKDFSKSSKEGKDKEKEGHTTTAGSDKQPHAPAQEIDPNIVVLSVDECLQAQERFRKETDSAYMQAVREQETVATHGSVPVFFIILLVILGFNEFVAILSNPFLLLFVILFGAIGYLIYVLNLGGPVFAIGNTVFNQGLSMVMQNVNKAAAGAAKPKTD